MFGASEQRWYVYYPHYIYVFIIWSLFRQEQRKLDMFSLMYEHDCLCLYVFYGIKNM